jgi:hypothetical protein
MEKIKNFFANTKIDIDNSIVDEEKTDDIEKFVIENYPTLISVFHEAGGKSIEGGIFRIHSFGSSATWSNLLREYFPDFELNFYCFGYDWMGCMYCYSLNEEPTVYIFDPADMESREAPATIEEFFSVDLIEHKEETLMLKKLKSIRKKINVGLIEIDKCLGYKESLFLGGEDCEDNFDIWDLEVYWNFQHKIYTQIKDLPEGAEIGEINFED